VERNNFSIINKTKSTLPRVPFANIKDAALGNNYSLSLVFIGEKASQKLNGTYRGKNKPTNILSFPLDEESGEIFITLSVAKKEAASFDRTLDNFIAFLFIHGLCHLKGHDHGDTMEKAEVKLRKLFDI
jgi:probable rRNA maturation factor